MAYNLSASLSSSLSQFRTHETLNFPQKLNLRKPSLRISSAIDFQEPATYRFSRDPETHDKKSTAPAKSHVWVNPKSPRASQLKKNTYDYRFDSLVKIAESLNSCSPVEDDISAVLCVLGDNILEQDAVIVLNNMSNARTAPIVLRYFQKRLKGGRDVVLYNVTLKVFRKCKVLDRAEKLFDEMLERGVKPDNITFSTIIICARQCSLPNKAVEWFEKMSSFGCEPDDVTWSVMIDSYGRAGNVDVALSLYDRARSGKWRLDAVTFATLIKIYGSKGNFDGCLNLYEEMKALKVRPNASVYNSILDAMGRAKRPWQAKTIYRDMVKNGVEPTWGTYAALVRAYCRARYGEDALDVYREMKEKGFELTVVLYNTLLSTCADLGLTDKALEIFMHMKSSGTCTPDNWTFSSLITIYSCSGQVEEAEAKLTEMLEAGYEPNIFVLTSIIQCYGKSARIDDVVKTFDRVLELGITPDERFLGCLLNVITQSPNEELYKLTTCIEKANPKLSYIVKLIIDGENESLKEGARELFGSIGADVRKAYCNCLIDLCLNLNRLDIASVLFELGLEVEIYRNVMSKSSTQWSLHLKGLSFGAAMNAMRVWMSELNKAIEKGEELPPLLGINTGHGKHKFSEKALASVFEGHLKELSAPFREVNDRAGWFLTSNVEAASWLDSRRV